MYGFGGAQRRTWETPECVGMGRLLSRSPLVPFPDPEAALADDREQSPWFQSLNGDWKFSLCPQPEASPEDFFSRDFDDESWSEIPVPSNWTLEGYDRPHYTNVQMPFPEPPPTVPKQNPTGLYRRRFQIPESWEGRRVVLHFGGAESVLYVYLNGHPVGMSKDSRLPAEFDLTPHLRSRARTCSRPWWCAGRTPPISRIRITGSWPASTAASTLLLHRRRPILADVFEGRRQPWTTLL